MLSKDIGQNNNEDKDTHDGDNDDVDKDTDVQKKMSSITEVDLPALSIVIRLRLLPCAPSPLLVTMIPLMGDNDCGVDDDDGGYEDGEDYDDDGEDDEDYDDDDDDDNDDAVQNGYIKSFLAIDSQ